ncbi:MAG: hypothetical protein KKB20_19205 [Proteobacteria bacterium]|nr:hypothetical protein [Pseudomonadota bacterium]
MKRELYYSEAVIWGLYKVSRQRLYHWRELGIIPKREAGLPRGYSFPDILSIKVVVKLLEAGCRLNKIAAAVRKLKGQPNINNNPLTEKKLFFTGNEICALLNGKVYEVNSGQFLLFDPRELIKELKRELAAFDEYHVSPSYRKVAGRAK